MAYAPVNIISKHGGHLVKLWNRHEATELDRLRQFHDAGFGMMGRFYKVYSPNNTDLRTDMGGQWKVCSNGYCITTKSSEADADTFIRKAKDAVNTHEGTDTVKRMTDI